MKIGLHIYYLVFDGRLSVLIGNVDMNLGWPASSWVRSAQCGYICSWEGALEMHTLGMKFKVRMSEPCINVWQMVQSFTKPPQPRTIGFTYFWIALKVLSFSAKVSNQLVLCLQSVVLAFDVWALLTKAGLSWYCCKWNEVWWFLVDRSWQSS
jgi:hypothetical protein